MPEIRRRAVLTQAGNAEDADRQAQAPHATSASAAPRRRVVQPAYRSVWRSAITHWDERREQLRESNAGADDVSFVRPRRVEEPHRLDTDLLTAFKATVRYSTGGTAYGLIQTIVCSEGGDSG
jgi:hypothetical protein